MNRIVRVALPLLAVARLAAAAGAQEPLVPCRLPGLAEPARCGTVAVPENRAEPGGRTLHLRVAVVPARNPAREAITVIPGGPGQATLPMAAGAAAQLDELRDDRDLLFVDARGTGESNPLQCAVWDAADPQSWLGPFLASDAVRRCRDALSDRADLAQYTSQALAADLDAVREALGYERLDLYGISYGTRLAQVYMRAYPARVRSVVLQGAVPMDFASPTHFPRAAEAAVTGIVARCAADPACAAAFPGIGDAPRTALARLEAGPAEVEVLDAASGAWVRLAFGRALFGEALRQMAYTPHGAAQLPAVLHRAAAGDFAPLAREVLAQRRRVSAGIHLGLFLSVTCAEDVPAIDTADARRRAEGTLMGDVRLREQTAACRAWPRGAVPADFRSPVASDAPALLLSGALDPATPAWGAEAVAAHLPNALHVVIPHAGHGYDGMPGTECVDRLVIDFLRAGTTSGLDASCVSRVRPVPFVLALADPVRVPADVLAPLAGRYAAAAPPVTVTVEARDAALRARFGEGAPFLLIPLSPTRYQAEGMPAGYEMEFTVADGRATGMMMKQPDQPPIPFARVP